VRQRQDSGRGNGVGVLVSGRDGSGSARWRTRERVGRASGGHAGGDASSRLDRTTCGPINRKAGSAQGRTSQERSRQHSDSQNAAGEALSVMRHTESA